MRSSTDTAGTRLGVYGLDITSSSSFSIRVSENDGRAVMVLEREGVGLRFPVQVLPLVEEARVEPLRVRARAWNPGVTFSILVDLEGVE